MERIKNVKKKLLSHRLRGFSDIEHTPSAFKKACIYQIPYIEIDVRASRDGVLFVYHNPISGSDIGGRIDFRKNISTEIQKNKFINGESILDLETALELFKKYRSKNQVLCIDIKDYGYEHKYIQSVKKYNLINSIHFISWIPQTIFRLYNLGAKAPLIFSHLNIMRYGNTGRMLKKLIKNKIIILITI